MLAVPEKHLNALFGGMRAIGATAGKQEGGIGIALNSVRAKLLAAKPDIVGRRAIEVDPNERLSVMMAVDHVAENATASTKHWASKAAGKLIGADPSTMKRVVL